MSDKEPHEIVIIKRQATHEEGPHGGAWKIAFADFMTAMMALFLVLWLISSTSDKTKRAVAQYFNPVKLVDMTTQKKGFRDPKENEMGSGRMPYPSTPESETSEPRSRENDPQPNKEAPKHSETDLFNDPYASLSKIAATERPETKASISSDDRATKVTRDDSFVPFEDPFSTVPERLEREAVTEPPMLREAEKSQSIGDRRAAAHGQDAEPASDPPEPPSKMRRKAGSVPPDRSVPARLPDDRELDKLKADLVAAVKAAAQDQATPQIEVRRGDDGLLISLTDNENYTMFAIGSAEPQKKTIEIMAKIAKLLETRMGALVIRGHTDGRPYRSANYDNWRLATARAHMAHYMLVRGGLDDNRIEKIEGYADRRLKNADDRNAPENRRIEILIRKEKS